MLILLLLSVYSPQKDRTLLYSTTKYSSPRNSSFPTKSQTISPPGVSKENNNNKATRKGANKSINKKIRGRERRMLYRNRCGSWIAPSKPRLAPIPPQSSNTSPETSSGTAISTEEQTAVEEKKGVRRRGGERPGYAVVTCAFIDTGRRAWPDPWNPFSRKGNLSRIKSKRNAIEQKNLQQDLICLLDPNSTNTI